MNGSITLDYEVNSLRFNVKLSWYSKLLFVLIFTAIQVLYLKNKLGYSENDATVQYHGFTSFVYFMCFFGGILSDIWLGKFKTILYLSIVYAIGSTIVSISATPIFDLMTSKTAFTVGLLLVALGSGGIKPWAHFYCLFHQFRWLLVHDFNLQQMYFGIRRRSIQIARTSDAINNVLLIILLLNKRWIVTFNSNHTDSTRRCSLFWWKWLFSSRFWSACCPNGCIYWWISFNNHETVRNWIHFFVFFAVFFLIGKPLYTYETQSSENMLVQVTKCVLVAWILTDNFPEIHKYFIHRMQWRWKFNEGKNIDVKIFLITPSISMANN